jgi:hypothetical protein
MKRGWGQTPMTNIVSRTTPDTNFFAEQGAGSRPPDVAFLVLPNKATPTAVLSCANTDRRLFRRERLLKDKARQHPQAY